jgi:hypothetical protein
MEMLTRSRKEMALMVNIQKMRSQRMGIENLQWYSAKFESQIQGTLSGFDRVLFRGSLRRLTHGDGMKMYLIRNGLLCKQFADHVKEVSAELKEASLAPFLQQKLPVEYIRDPQADKD